MEERGDTLLITENRVRAVLACTVVLAGGSCMVWILANELYIAIFKGGSAPSRGDVVGGVIGLLLVLLFVPALWRAIVIKVSAVLAPTGITRYLTHGRAREIGWTAIKSVGVMPMGRSSSFQIAFRTEIPPRLRGLLYSKGTGIAVDRQFVPMVMAYVAKQRPDLVDASWIKARDDELAKAAAKRAA